MESLHQIEVVVSSKTICRVLKTNADAILNNLQDRVQSERFFILYHNMNFYERVCDQQLYNRAHILSYTAGYVCFMKASNRLPMPHLTSDDIDYFAVNKLSAEDILLSPSGEQYQSEAIRYILSITFSDYFEDLELLEPNASPNPHLKKTIHYKKAYKRPNWN